MNMPSSYIKIKPVLLGFATFLFWGFGAAPSIGSQNQIAFENKAASIDGLAVTRALEQEYKNLKQTDGLEPGSDNFFKQYLLANAALNFNDYEMASKQFGMSIKDIQAKPVPDKLLWLLSLTQLNGGQYEEAVKTIRSNKLTEFNEWTKLLIMTDSLLQKDYDEVISQGRPWLQFSGVWGVTGTLLVAQALGAQGKWDAAHNAINDSTIAKDVKQLADISNAALYIQEGKPAKALDLTKPIENNDSLDGIIYLNYSRLRLYIFALIALDREQEAIEALSHRVLKNQSDWGSKNFLEQLKAGKGKELLALEKSNPARSLSPRLYIFAASSLNQIGEVGLSLLRLSEALDPTDGRIKLSIASFFQSKSQYELAYSILDAISNDKSLGIDPLLKKSDVLLLQGKEDESIDLLRKISTEYETDIESFARLGFIYRTSNKFEQAANEYQNGIDRLVKIGLNPYEAGFLYHYLGVSFERAGKWDQAEKAFLTSLSYRPDDSDTLNYLGYSWIDKGIKLAEGTKMVVQAAKQNPGDGYIIDSLGWAFYRQGLYDQALKELERAIQLMPYDPIVNDHLGDAYWKVGRYREAKFQWQRSIEFKPEEEARLITEKKLKNGLQ